MNATQSKAVLAVCNEALTLLAYHPQASELRARLDAAVASTPARKPANGKVDQRKAWLALATAEFRAWQASGETVEAFQKRVLERFSGWTAKENVLQESGFDRKVWEAQHALCACGGDASDHAEDEVGNLLKCSHCELCDHFHYETSGEGEAVHASVRVHDRLRQRERP